MERIPRWQLERRPVGRLTWPMAADTGREQAAWINMTAAMFALREAGKLPEESARIIFEGLVEGSLLDARTRWKPNFRMGRATVGQISTWILGIWRLTTQPPLGHLVWLQGEVRVDLVWDKEGRMMIGGFVIYLPSGGLLARSATRRQDARADLVGSIAPCCRRRGC